MKGECFTPNKTVSEWLIPVLKGIWNHSENKAGGSTFARNLIKQQAVRVNGFPVELNELVDFPVVSIVVFPKSASRRITLFWDFIVTHHGKKEIP